MALPAPRVSCFFQLPRTTTQTRFTGVLEATGCSTLSSRSMTTLCFPGRVFPVTAATRSTSFTRALLSGSSSTQTPLLFSGHRRSGAMITAVTQSCRVRAELWKLSASSRIALTSMASKARGFRTLAVAESSNEPKRVNGYPHEDIESKWQTYWAENQTFRTPDQVDMSKPKFYALDMFPYPRCIPLFSLNN